jgi:dephospho-CoA kinase
MGKRPLWIGLTGNIACGKSTVARMLAEMGAYVIDADAIAHEVIRKGTPAYEAILRRFGPGILRADGGPVGGGLNRVRFIWRSV